MNAELARNLAATRGFDDDGRPVPAEAFTGHPLRSTAPPQWDGHTQLRQVQRMELLTAGMVQLVFQRDRQADSWNTWASQGGRGIPRVDPNTLRQISNALRNGPEALILAMNRAGLQQVHRVRFLRWMARTHPERMAALHKPLQELSELQTRMFRQGVRIALRRCAPQLTRDDEILVAALALGEAIERIETRRSNGASLNQLARVWTKPVRQRFLAQIVSLRWPAMARGEAVRRSRAWAEASDTDPDDRGDEPAGDPYMPDAPGDPGAEAWLWWRRHGVPGRGTSGGPVHREGPMLPDGPPGLPDEVAHALERALSDLRKRRSGEVLAAYLGLSGPPRTYSEIGRQFNLSRERIRQIVHHALVELESVWPDRLPGAVHGTPPGR